MFEKYLRRKSYEWHLDKLERIQKVAKEDRGGDGAYRNQISFHLTRLDKLIKKDRKD